MEDNYYIQKNGEQTGPFTLHELIQMELLVDTMILSPEYDGWQKAADLPELFEYFEARGIYFPTDDNLAGFWWRLMAYITDTIIMSYPLSFVAPPGLAEIFNRALNSTATSADFFVILKYNLISFIMIAVYHSAFESSAFQGSLGKKLFKILVVDADGRKLSFIRALGRNMGKIVSTFAIYIGYLSVLWDTHKQAWHDRWAKTYVIIRNQ